MWFELCPLILMNLSYENMSALGNLSINVLLSKVAKHA